MGIKGYKVFNNDWSCRGFFFEVGKTYVHEGSIKICEAGFHFCKNLVDCFNYYRFDPKNKIAEIEATDWVADGDKIVCNKISILRELSWHDCLDLVNTGIHNTGHSNSGDYNTGHHNTGERNTGHHNTGDYNSGIENSGNSNSGNHNSGNYNTGIKNSGNYNTGSDNLGHLNTGHHNLGDNNSGNNNTGDYNTGAYNSGDYNSGSRNAGNRNSGNFNSGDNNSGFFNSTSPAHPRLFNRETTADWGCINKITEIMNRYFREEGECSYKSAWKNMWNGLSFEDKQEFYSLPNFDWSVFTEITGIEKE